MMLCPHLNPTMLLVVVLVDVLVLNTPVLKQLLQWKVMFVIS